MEIRQIQAVAAVARYRNFTRAAEQLHVAQPALSTHVRNVERELGVVLFERTSRRVVLTPAGEAFLTRADRILTDVDALRREMEEFRGLVRGRVRLGAWYTVNPPLAGLLARFVAAHPHIEIVVREEVSDSMLAMVRRGELDVAMAIMRPDLDLADLEQMVFLEEPFVVVTAPTHPLASRRSIALSELQDVPLITLKPGAAIRILTDRALAAAGVTPRIAVETGETASARGLVAVGIGAALIPRSVTQLPGPLIHVIDIQRPPMRVSAIVWRRGGQASAPATFIDFARRYFGHVVDA